MARFMKSTIHDIGLAPDELVFRGKKKMENSFKRIIIYNSEQLEEQVIKQVSDIPKIMRAGYKTWINIDGLHDEMELQKLGEILDIDQIIMSDVMNVNQRAKIQVYDKAIFVSLKMIQYDEAKNEIHAEQLSVVIKDSLIISFQEQRGDVFDPIRERLRKKRRVCQLGADYLGLSLIDVVVDNYLLIMSLLGDKIELLEEDLVHSTNNSLVRTIYDYKNELNYLRKNILPTKDMVQFLAKSESELLDPVNSSLIRELFYNCSNVVETSESYREILSDQLNLYHTQVSNKLNDIMKVLTIFSALFIPLTFIAGVYGTNFNYIPELGYRYSYFIMLGVMAVLAIGMLIFFWKKKWFKRK